MTTTTTTSISYSRKLLHRWFVQYNPLYLVSAMLVLGGTILSSRGLAHESSLFGQIGVAAIAELYSLVLIAGAALLMRLKQRRSAVMLSLLTVLYQCDLTLHTETCPNLGSSIAVVATCLWLFLFIAKLFALAWAMNVKIARWAITTATLGASGLAFMPYVLADVENRTNANGAVMLWLFTLFAIPALRQYRYAPDDPRSYIPTVINTHADAPETKEAAAAAAWAHTVQRRTITATWTLWSLLLTLHIGFWSMQFRGFTLAVVIPVLPLIGMRVVKRESRIWFIAATLLIATLMMAPFAFSVVALLVAAALGLRAYGARFASRTTVVTTTTPPTNAPYRLDESAADDDAHAARAEVVTRTVKVSDEGASMRRLLIGSITSLYLSAWTLQWNGGPWPNHILALDLLFAIVLVIGIWKARARVASAPLAITTIHLIAVSHVLPTPRSTLEWGGASIGLGFILLLASLGISYWLRGLESESHSSLERFPARR